MTSVTAALADHPTLVALREGQTFMYWAPETEECSGQCDPWTGALKHSSDCPIAHGNVGERSVPVVPPPEVTCPECKGAGDRIIPSSDGDPDAALEVACERCKRRGSVPSPLLVCGEQRTELRCERCGASASLPLGMTCSDHRPTCEWFIAGLALVQQPTWLPVYANNPKTYETAKSPFIIATDGIEGGWLWHDRSTDDFGWTWLDGPQLVPGGLLAVWEPGDLVWLDEPAHVPWSVDKAYARAPLPVGALPSSVEVELDG